MAIAILIVLSGIVLYAGDAKASNLSNIEMAKISGKGCCTGTTVSDSCSGDGGSCKACQDCTGSYTAPGGTLRSCISGVSQSTCSSSSATCTHTVTCQPGTAVNGTQCLTDGCQYSSTTCVPCTSSSSPNMNTTQSCG